LIFIKETAQENLAWSYLLKPLTLRLGKPLLIITTKSTNQIGINLMHPDLDLYSLARHPKEDLE
jgi:hypothetical protein